MRLSIVSFLMGFAATAAAVTLTLPTDGSCIDLTKNMLVEWTATAQEVQDIPQVSFRLANYNGAWPNVNDPLPLSVDGSVPTRRGYVLIPRMSYEDAMRYHNMNNGQGFTIRITRGSLTLEDESHLDENHITIARPGEGC
ncbi:hypothetical protein N7488_002250 [Penicillium malachiteum]|nr:hypothetical protein N7488_002250 [Penicillium malachiteum]